jgi:1-acyl-sn-glycerol-3-phosphate acyltransferase
MSDAQGAQTSSSRGEPVIGRPGPLARAVYATLRGMALLIARLYCRFEVVGTERMPTSGGLVISPIHRSNLDFLLACLASPRRVRWMAKHTIFKGGLIDWFLMSMGAFPVNRDLADRTALRICEELLDAGEAVVMFPEGRRKEGDTVEDLFRGPAFVAARRRVPIVPVGIGGSDAAMPIGKKLIYPRKIVCILGEPLYPDVELEGRVSRDQVNELLERLRVDLERLYADAKALL